MPKRSASRSTPVKQGLKSTGAREANGAAFLTKGAVAEAVGKYIKAHPKTYRVTVGVKGKKVVVVPAGKAKAARTRRWPVLPPPGFFDQYYTAEDALEDRRLTPAKVYFDPIDLPE